MKTNSLLAGLLSLFALIPTSAQAQVQALLTADRTTLDPRGSAFITASFVTNGQPIPRYTVTLNPGVGTLITISSGRYLYRAPSAVETNTTVQVRLFFSGASTPAAFLNLNLRGTAPAPVPTLSLTPNSGNVNAGASLAFTALQNGSPTAGVTWRIQPQVGSISAAGVYTAPGNLSAQTAVVVTATLNSNPSVLASATVQVMPPAPPPPPPTPTLTLTPASANVAAGGTAAFVALANGVPTGSVTWQISPTVGSISAAGVYTAPSNLTSATNVQVMARLSSNTSVTATANVQVQPPAPTLSITPSSATVLQNASVTFAARSNGVPTTAVTWQISPAFGIMSSTGVYTAPRTVSTSTSVLVTARLNSNNSVTATASVQVQPPAPTLSITPGSMIVAPGATANFTAMSNNTPTTAVTWQISPTVGSISSSGVYTAPANLSSSTSVQVTARLNSNTSVSANATVQVQPPIAITLTPASATVQAGQQSTLTATVTGTTNTAVTWALSPNFGTISNGVYTAPASVTQNTTVTVTARSAADTNRSATSTLSVTPGSAQAPPPTQSTLTMPIEVYGPNGFVVSRQFTANATQASGAQRLYLQVHGLNFAQEASVQVNNAAWVELNDTNYQLYPLDRIYGGVGGGFSTVRGTVTLPAGTVVNGTNTIRFRFNRTDGFTNGFRVLAFNLRNSANADLLPTSLFVQEDPSTWRPPLTDAASIAAGRDLWYNAPLTAPQMGSIRARCSDCHAQDGRDLKYFNYSNDVIRSRAVFHGLSDTQGNQIASYIRSLNTIAPGRPWNPPYQPGPGLDSKPVAEWSAGAGLEWVLDRDRDTLSYIFPNGFEPSRVMASGNLNVRETPVAMQLPDWNGWLPQIHPKDYLPNFENSEGFRTYLATRAHFRPGDVSRYLSPPSRYGLYAYDHRTLVQSYKPNDGDFWPELAVRQQYSAQLWQMTKEWELAQEFQTEGMNRAWFGPQAEERGWNNQIPFFASPNMIQMPGGLAGIRNGSRHMHTYLSYIWYHLQLIVNNSNKKQEGNSPIDWPYVHGFIGSMDAISPQASLVAIWVSKGMQIQENNIGPEVQGHGWDYRVAGAPFTASDLVEEAYRDISATDRNSMLAVLLRQWLQKARGFSTQQWYSWQTRRTEVPVNNPPPYDGNMPSRVHWMLQTYRRWGVDPALLRETADWAQTMWPNYSWRSGLGL